MKLLRVILSLLGILFILFTPLLRSSSAHAVPISGLNVDVYTYEPGNFPDRQPYVLCEGAWTHVDNIDQMYDDNNAGVVAGCQPDFVLVHYTGFVTFPDSGTYAFSAPADDGFWLSLDEKPIITNDWFPKGRWGGVYPDIEIKGDYPYALDVWFYEYGGGANATLTYSPDNGVTWATVPSEFFTTDGSAPVKPPVVVPPIVEPPIVEPPVIIEPPVVVDPNPPVVTPPDPQPPVVDPPVEPPVIPPVIPDPPVVDPPLGPVVEPKPPVEIPVVNPPVVDPLPPVVQTPTDLPVSKPELPSEPPITQVDPATIDPTTLSPQEVTQLQAVANETLATASEGSPEYQQALEQLAVAAQADDIVVDEQLASTPVIGAAVVGVVNAINALGNLGADMSPAHRETAKKEVVAAVVVTQIAVAASGLATQAAASASAGAAGAASSRKKN